MTKFIAVISGKGGVGKTTTSINLALALTGIGRRSVVVDADLYTPNIGLHMGKPLLDKTSYDAITSEESIRDVSYRHRSGLHMIPSKLHANISKSHFTVLAEQFDDLMGTAEIVLVDMPSGLHADIKEVLIRCDYSLIVTTPDMPSVTNALKAMKMANDVSTPVLGVVVNRSDGLENDMDILAVEGMLSTKVLVSIPTDDAIRESIHLKSPVLESHPNSEASECFRKLAVSLL